MRPWAEARSISGGTATSSSVEAAQVMERLAAQCPGADFHKTEA